VSILPGVEYIVFYDGSTSDRVFFSFNTTSVAYTKGNANSLTGSGQILQFSFSIPVAGWQATNVISPSTTAASWSGALATSTSWTTTTGSFTSPAANTSGTTTLTQTQNNNFGTVTAASGTIEGITFTPPKISTLYICAHTAVSSDVNGQIGVYELTDGSGTVIAQPMSNGDSNGNIMSLCGNYNVTSIASATTAKVQLRNNTGSQSIRSQPYLTGGNAVLWTILDVSQGLNAPLSIGSVTSNSLGAELFGRAKITQTGNSTCSVVSSNSAWVGVTCSGPGQTVLTFTGFSSAPSCSMTGTRNGSSYYSRFQGSPTASGIMAVISDLSGVAQNGDYDLNCWGPR
jgi:hypothetical protein